MISATRRVLRFGVIAIAIVISIVTVIAIDRLDTERKRLMDVLRLESWTIVEAERSAIRLQMKYAQFRAGEIPSSDVGEAFDILWSRVNFIFEGPDSKYLTAGLDLEQLQGLKVSLPVLETRITGALADLDDTALRDETIEAITGAGEVLHNAVIVSLAHSFGRADPDAEAIMFLQHEILLCLILLITSAGALMLFLLREIRLSERLLYHARDSESRAESANQAKTRFLASASHDLRQPLNTLSILIGFLKQRTVGKERQMAMTCEEAIAGLVRQLDIYLDITNLESGQIVPNLGTTDIGIVLERVVRLLQPEAKRKNINLRIRPAPFSLICYTDPGLLERVLANLVGNAVTHTERGSVLVACRKRGNRLRVDVLDTGPGIPENQQNDIFADQEQLGNRARDARNGHGFGLSIVQRLARILDMPIELSSRPGHGSRFSIYIETSDEPVRALPGLDDEQPALLQSRERSTDLRRAALSDDYAIKLRHQAPPGTPAQNPAPKDNRAGAPDNPTSAAQGYRAPASDAATIILASADRSIEQSIEHPGTLLRLPDNSATPSSYQVCLEANLKSDNMAACQQAYRDQMRSVSSEWGSKVASSKTVLFVEDDDMIAYATMMIIEQAGLVPFLARTGEEALEMIETQSVSLIVTDYRLPGLNGLETVARIKAKPGMQHLPVILITGDAGHEVREQAKENGVKFLQKPVKPEKLIELLTSYTMDGAIAMSG